MSEFQARVQDFLIQLAGVKDVYTAHRLMQGAWTPGISRIRGGFNQQRSGDVTIQVMPGWRYVNADTQESKMMREAYVAFPIILYGTGVKPELILSLCWKRVLTCIERILHILEEVLGMTPQHLMATISGNDKEISKIVFTGKCFVIDILC